MFGCQGLRGAHTSMYRIHVRDQWVFTRRHANRCVSDVTALRARTTAPEGTRPEMLMNRARCLVGDVLFRWCAHIKDRRHGASARNFHERASGSEGQARSSRRWRRRGYLCSLRGGRTLVENCGNPTICHCGNKREGEVGACGSRAVKDFVCQWTGSTWNDATYLVPQGTRTPELARSLNFWPQEFRQRW